MTTPSHPTIEIHRANLTDLEPAVRLFDAYRQFYRLPSEPGRARAFLADRLRNQDSVIFLGRLAGFPTPVGFVQLYPTFSSVSIGRALVLNDLFVEPAARGRGIAQALLLRAAAFARETGARYLELATEIGNGTAQRVYERLGWVRDTEFYHYSFTLPRP